jgi:hypothetical protein
VCQHQAPHALMQINSRRRLRPFFR